MDLMYAPDDVESDDGIRRAVLRELYSCFGYTRYVTLDEYAGARPRHVEYVPGRAILNITTSRGVYYAPIHAQNKSYKYLIINRSSTRTICASQC